MKCKSVSHYTKGLPGGEVGLTVGGRVLDTPNVLRASDELPNSQHSTSGNRQVAACRRYISEIRNLNIITWLSFYLIIYKWNGRGLIQTGFNEMDIVVVLIFRVYLKFQTISVIDWWNIIVELTQYFYGFLLRIEWTIVVLAELSFK